MSYIFTIYYIYILSCLYIYHIYICIYIAYIMSMYIYIYIISYIHIENGQSPLSPCGAETERIGLLIPLTTNMFNTA